MNRTHRPDPATTKSPGRNPGEKRHPHSIRFTEAEWTAIQQAAARHGLTPGEIVRARALGLSDKPFHADMPASFSPGHVALIEATYRAVHLLATMATQPMPYEEVDALLGAAHHALLATLDEEPAGAVAGESLSTRPRPRHTKQDELPSTLRGFVPI